MSIKSTGFFAAIPFACGVAGGLLGGVLVDTLVRRGMTPMASRKVAGGDFALFGTAACTLSKGRLRHQQHAGHRIHFRL